VDAADGQWSVRQQCELLSLNRSTWYYPAATESAENLCLMRLIDEQYLQRPFFGSRRMAVWLQSVGHVVNRKRVQRLMRLMGIEALAGWQDHRGSEDRLSAVGGLGHASVPRDSWLPTDKRRFWAARLTRSRINPLFPPGR
jgi:hypothetical protein